MKNFLRTRKKRTIFFLVGFLVLLIFTYFSFKPGGWLSATELGHLVSLFINLNSIEIKTSDDLSKEKVKIYWSCYPAEKVLLIDGKRRINRMKPCYGGDIFRVYYDDNPIAEITHGKQNNWHYHKYLFSLYRENGIIRVNVKIIGPDENISISPQQGRDIEGFGGQGNYSILSTPGEYRVCSMRRRYMLNEKTVYTR